LSQLEEVMAFQIRAANLPAPEREVRAIPSRRFRWDFAWGKWLVEVQGGTWTQGRTAHSTGAGIARDARKNNLAVRAGYKILYFTSDMIKSGEALKTIQEALSGEDIGKE